MEEDKSMQADSPGHENRATRERPEPFSSNAVRLSLAEWGFAYCIAAAVVWLVQTAWPHLERFEPGRDYRIPYSLSNDYWHYARYARRAAQEGDILVVGDSVVWGEYVSPGGTFTACLNEQTDKTMGNDAQAASYYGQNVQATSVSGTWFVNLGVNGIHPAALAGLIDYYGRDIAGKRVVLHYNPLWMSSKRHDLQTEKEFRFNHPKLVPQFTPAIPCYKESYAVRLGVVIERYLPVRNWANHLAVAYFDNKPVVRWAVTHPYENPLRQITLQLPAPGAGQRHRDAPWYEKGISRQPFEWVMPADSLQWRLFKETVRTLEDRDNELFVLVGPFNEHMIAEQSLEDYQNIKTGIGQWLDGQGIPHHVFEALPSELYADASHPRREGYALLAKRLLELNAFEDFCTTEPLQTM